MDVSEQIYVVVWGFDVSPVQTTALTLFDAWSACTEQIGLEDDMVLSFSRHLLLNR